MVQQHGLEIDDYISILRRRWWLLLIPGILGAGLAYGISLLLMNRYTSRSLVLVERQQVSDNFVRPVISTDLDQRLATLEEQVLSRTRLEPIIKNFELFKEKEIFDLTRFKPVARLLAQLMGQGSEAPTQWRIEQMREAIAVLPVQSVIQDPKGGLPGFYITFTYNNRHVAEQVCDRITSMFIDEDIRYREQAAAGTTDFLDNQLQDAKRQLDEQDARLARFKEKYLGALPDDTQTNLSILTTLNVQLEGVGESIQRAAQDKTYVESLLDQQLQSLKARNSPANTPVDTLQKQLAQMEAKLIQLKSEYTDQYPDVVNLEASIRLLKEKIQDQDTAGAKPKGSSSSPKSDSNAPNSTAQRPLLVEPHQVMQLRSQLRADEDNLKALYAEQQQLKQKIGLYQSRINMSPAIEEEYKGITRDHQTAVNFYDGLLKKKQESTMAADLQRRQQGEQFRVMDPADLPATPSFPNRPLFGVAGFGLGLTIGLGLIWLVEGRDRILRTERDVETLLGVPALAAVPNVVTRPESKGDLSIVKKGKP